MTELEQAGQHVAEAFALCDPNQYPEIWKALKAAWQLIDAQVDYELEAREYDREN